MHSDEPANKFTAHRLSLLRHKHAFNDHLSAYPVSNSSSQLQNRD